MKYSGLIRSTFKLLCSGSEQTATHSRLPHPLCPPRRQLSTSLPRAAVDVDQSGLEREPDKAPPREKCMNEIYLLGRVGREPEKRGTDTKQCMVFSLATNTYYKEDEYGNFEQRTDWHRVAVFSPALRLMVERQVTRGSRLVVTGKVVYDAFHDAAGVRHKTTTILANNVYFLSPGRQQTPEQNPEYEAADEYLKVKE